MENEREPGCRMMINELIDEILSALTYYKECWEFLAGEDNLYMLGKAEAMDTAIRIIQAETENRRD